ncbi:uncharacterized protein VTP21DRAFT_11683 [Calcarisporiella thermophila]|uniref:uncharacterized protein n=1 Tax=Calcarisporiella thermophila TaxID=911321 RepID=UPI0037424062
MNYFSALALLALVQFIYAIPISNTQPEILTSPISGTNEVERDIQRRAVLTFLEEEGYIDEGDWYYEELEERDAGEEEEEEDLDGEGDEDEDEDEDGEWADNDSDYEYEF